MFILSITKRRKQQHVFIYSWYCFLLLCPLVKLNIYCCYLHLNIYWLTFRFSFSFLLKKEFWESFYFVFHLVSLSFSLFALSSSYEFLERQFFLDLTNLSTSLLLFSECVRFRVQGEIRCWNLLFVICLFR